VPKTGQAYRSNATSPVGTEQSKSPARKCRVGARGKDRVPKGTAQDDTPSISRFGGSTLTPNLISQSGLQQQFAQ